MSQLKISIVTPSFNQGQFIEQTIDSVLSQGYENLEYVIIDGGSTDNSKEIIKKYEKHLKYWASEPDGGQSHAINKGLARCTGDIFNWINSDDYYEPGAFELVNQAFQDETISMACFTSKVFGLQKRISRGTDIFPGNLPKAIAYSRIDQPETFFRMDAVMKMGPVDTALHYCMDKEWLIRYFLLFGNENIYASSVPILNFRYHEDSKSVSRQNQFAKEADKIYAGLARQIGYHEHGELITSLSDLQYEEIAERNFPRTETMHESILGSSLDYYLFKRFIEFYENLEFDDCNKISDVLNPENLSPSDQTHLKKLLFRSTNVPKWALRTARKFSR
jgi:glycosyltransferase involved in cell wall biosynthesis